MCGDYTGLSVAMPWIGSSGMAAGALAIALN
jgi:hypothetical protein